MSRDVSASLDHSCDCGDKMRWKAHGLLSPRYRLECICGRCGPWRSQADSRLAGQPPMLKATTPPPPSK